MSLFGLGKSAERFGIIIDIGSGSVLTAIVYSDPNKKHPQIIWSHREHAPLQNIDSLEKSAKAVMAALVNASMLLDAEGRKILYDFAKEAKLTEVQCSISAPWSYTVTKTVNYKQDEEFIITDNLIDDLISSIQDKIKGDLQTNAALKNLGLQVITNGTMDMLSSGYRVQNPVGEKTNNLSISHVNVVAQEYLIDAIDEMQQKLFVQAETKKISFILMLFSVVRELLPNTFDVCLVDVTYEATEIGVVRDGVLSYSTHISFGSFSLAREISEITKVPLHESFGYLHTEKPYSFMATLPRSRREDVEQVFEAYIERVSELFHETGDQLSIPKRIALHVDLGSESLFLDLIEKAAKRRIKTDPNITPISKEIIRQTFESSTKGAQGDNFKDTALLLSAQFFHRKHSYRAFKYF